MTLEHYNAKRNKKNTKIKDYNYSDIKMIGIGM